MSLEKLDKALINELDLLKQEGRVKPPERVISGYQPALGQWGPRFLLQGYDQEFLRMNSNSYLSLSFDSRLLRAADEAASEFGTGPGAVRFIDGTSIHHIELENEIAKFCGKESAKIFNSAYTANCGLALSIGNKKTHWIGDQLNHNSIIRAMRVAGVPRGQKSIYQHNDLNDLRHHLEKVDEDTDRVIIIFDGIFSMRGDHAPIKEITQLAEEYHNKFADGVITVVDDSHGIGAYGATGRGTIEITNSSPDIIVGTFGKSFGVNGGFIAGSAPIIEAVRQKADTYIYTNPLSAADCAAATEAIRLCAGDIGKELLANLKSRTEQLREGLAKLEQETIAGVHPIIPMMVRDSEKTQALVKQLFDKSILVVGLAYPVVPRGDESIRFQVNAAHTKADIKQLLEVLESVL